MKEHISGKNEDIAEDPKLSNVLKPCPSTDAKWGIQAAIASVLNDIKMGKCAAILRHKCGIIPSSF